MERRNSRSDLAARVLAALPAIAFAIAIVWAGGLVFAIGLIGLGIICLHELYAMFDRAHPARLAGFLAIIGMALAAHYHQRDGLLLALVLTVPLTFFLVVAQRRGGAPANVVEHRRRGAHGSLEVLDDFEQPREGVGRVVARRSYS